MAAVAGPTLKDSPQQAAMSSAIELVHIIGLCRFLGLEIDEAVEVETDNKGAHDLCHRYSAAQHSKHIDRKMYKMREMRGAKIVTVKYIPTGDNTADMWTKVLSRQPFEKHRRAAFNLAAFEGLMASRGRDGADGGTPHAHAMHG